MESNPGLLVETSDQLLGVMLNHYMNFNLLKPGGYFMYHQV